VTSGVGDDIVKRKLGKHVESTGKKEIGEYSYTCMYVFSRGAFAPRRACTSGVFRSLPYHLVVENTVPPTESVQILYSYGTRTTYIVIHSYT